MAQKIKGKRWVLIILGGVGSLFVLLTVSFKQVVDVVEYLQNREYARYEVCQVKNVSSGMISSYFGAATIFYTNKKRFEIFYQPIMVSKIKKTSIYKIWYLPKSRIVVNIQDNR